MEAFTALDREAMAHALRLGRRNLGRTWPNPSVGCVLVKDGIVIGRGATQPSGRPHAETMALAHAGPAARGACAFVTLEPCSHYAKTGPCADALARAGVARVVSAIGDPDPRVHGRGWAMLRSFGIPVSHGLLAEEAALDHRGHFIRVRLGRPFTLLKLAMTADGFVAPEGGGRLAITGEAANVRVHLMRAQADAILAGVRTVLADDPMLTCRLPGMADRSPIRVVMDGGLRTPAGARIVATARVVPTWIIAAIDAPVGPEAALRAAGCEVMRVERGGDGRLDLGEALRLLATRGITRAMIEGGPSLANALLAADLVDEAAVIAAPRCLAEMGAEGPGLPAYPGLAPADRLALVASEPLGPDIMTTFRRV